MPQKQNTQKKNEKGEEREITEKFKTKKSLGQHFLNNPRVPEHMAQAAHIKKGDCILEIGPGTGVLTRALLKHGAKVIAVEADSRAISVLSETFQDEIRAKNLTIFHGDIRTLSIPSVLETEASSAMLTVGRTGDRRPIPYKVVSNIPYYLSGHLFRTFLQSAVQPSHIVFLVQKEVAERIVKSEKESLLSLSVKIYGDPTYVQTVKKGNFTPPPKIDSAIVSIANIHKKRLKNVSEDDFFTLLHASFASKRKQLLGNLAKKYDRESLLHIFSTLGIRADIRAEDISIDTWVALARALYPNT